nr:MAG TPA: hypothetical protein [Caudoviricetes sp.]
MNLKSSEFSSFRYFFVLIIHFVKSSTNVNHIFCSIRQWYKKPKPGRIKSKH